MQRRQLIKHAMVTLAALPLVGRTGSGRASAWLSPLNTTYLDEKLKATLPVGASLRIVAQSGAKPVPESDYFWHGAPDGGACFTAQDGGWIYVSNAELNAGLGGAGALRFDKQGQIVDSYSILKGTTRNCAGGRTLWGTWLSCEESGDFGLVYECDPFGQREAQVRPALGACNHEAVAMDPITGRAYLTEDMPDGGLYRFTPDQAGDLSQGLLEVAVINGDGIAWQRVPDPSAKATPMRYQVDNIKSFRGGEGIVYHDGHIYFTTKQDNRVWSLRLSDDSLALIYDVARSDTPILSGVDNIEVTPSGELLVAEDGGDMQIVALDKKGTVMPLITLHEQPGSEITGPAFSPDGSRLYFSSQRGYGGRSEEGITYELMLPWGLSISRE